MSIVKTNACQLGQSLTANQNFSWYQPSTPDGTVRLGVGNAGSTTLDAVTVNNSGNVGIGTSSPATKLHVSGTGSTPTLFERTGSNGVYLQLKDASGSSVFLGASNGVFAIQTPGSSYSDKLILDSSGNLGLGVTPKAWNSGLRAIQVGYSASIDSPTGAAYARWSNNAFVDSTGGFKYINTAVAQVYEQDNSGKHVWYTAPSGTAGNAISFTQAMTLDASGALLVGVTSKLYSQGHNIYSVAAGDWNTAFISTQSTAANNYGLRLTYTAASPNNVGNEFFYAQDSNALRLSIRSNGGIANFSANNVNLSDERVKTAITPAPSCLAKINAIEVVNFKYKDQTHEDPNLGVIAQQVLSVAPELVDEDGFGETPEDGVPLMAIFETDLKYAMLKAIQELSAELNLLKQKVNA